jgi:predicted membrane channel-forming protein YqfA (hemolysin III family)
LRSLVTATAVTVVAALLAFSSLYHCEQARKHAHRWLGRILLYAGVIGLILGETIWAFNYWRTNALTVGVLLMVLFYVLTGIVREYTRAGIRWQTVIEFLIVAALGTWIVVRFGPG